MATLNIKNLSDRLYRKLQGRAKLHRRSLAQEVTQILEESVQQTDLLSILDLKGLGKSEWSQIDPAKHVDGERRAWD